MLVGDVALGRHGRDALAIGHRGTLAKGDVDRHLMVRHAIDHNEDLAVGLGDPGVEFDQPELVGRLVPHEFSVEAAVVVADMLKETPRHIDHLAMHALGQVARVLQAVVGDVLADRVGLGNDAMHIEFTMEDRALRGALRTGNDLFGNTGVAVHLPDFRRQLDVPKRFVKGIAQLADTFTDLLDGLVELRLVFDLETQVGRERLDRLDPERVIQGHLGEGVVGKGVDGTEFGHYFRNDLLLLQAAPILVLALEHAFDRRSRNASFLAQDGHHHAGGKIPLSHDGIHRAVESVELAARLVEQRIE